MIKIYVKSRRLTEQLRCIFTCFLVVFFHLVFGQGGGGTVADPMNVFQAVDFLPPAPSSASLERYGGLNFGLNTGAMQHTIQMISVPAGKLSLPISLNYTSNGIRVDEIASRTGMSWTLNCGGVITRTVRGEVDELKQRFTAVPNFQQRDRTYINFLKTLSTEDGVGKYWDAEPDEFSFSFAGYSGRFVLDENLNPVLTTYSGLKIIRTDNTKFTIITPEGIKYIFGGASAIETNNRYTVGAGCGKTYPNNTVTAYYLSEIVHPNGDKITFSYLTIRYQYSVGVNASQMVRDRNVVPSACLNGAGSPANSNMACLLKYDTSTPYLNEIQFSSGIKASFVHIDRSDLGDKLLKKITVAYPGGKTRSFEMEYVQQMSVNGGQHSLVSSDTQLKYRPFLTSLKEIGMDNKVRTHRFSYYRIAELPPRISYAQDYYGYFNGVYNNSSFFPKPDELSWQRELTMATANREPNAAYANVGLLSRIVYPTGGSDSIIYESNTVYGSVKTLPPLTSAYVGVSGTGTTGIGVKESALIPIEETQEATFSFGATFNTSNPDIDPRHQLGIFELYEDNNLKISERLPVDQNQNIVVSLTAEKNYKFKVTASRGEAVHAGATLSYRAGKSTVTYQNKQGAGVRVAKVITETEKGQIADIKKYTYASLANRDVSSGTGTYVPIYNRYISVYYTCPPGNDQSEGGIGDCKIQEYKFYISSSNALYNVYQFGGAPVSYRHVIVEQEGTVNNGGIEYEFSVVPDDQGRDLLGQFLDAPTINNSDRNGLELAKYTFKKNGTTIVPVEKTVTKYRQDSRANRQFSAYIARMKYVFNCESEPPTQEEFDAFDFLIYTHNQRWIYPDTVINTIYDGAGGGAVVRTTLSNYDNMAHGQLSKSIMINSDGSKEIQLNLYPDDYASGTAFIDDMKASHLTAYPIEQVRYREAGSARTILSGTISRYLTGGEGRVDQVLELETPQPIALSSFKFSNRAAGQLPAGSTGATAFSPYSGYQTRLTYSSYDAHGNPRQVQAVGGAPVTYIWSYGGQYPVAEIKNGGFATVRSLLGGDQALKTFTDSYPSDTDLRSRFNGIRASLPNSTLTYYTYDPLNGMTSMTDPSGRTVYYSYDGLGRLQEVKDSEQKTTESYEYHYRNQ